MNTHQQSVLKEKITRDAALVQAYMVEVREKRQIRANSLNIAIGLSNEKYRQNNELKVSDEAVLESAEKIYKYLSQDGGLIDLSQESKITTL